KSGIPTEIVSIEHIGNTQTALLEFLKEYYNNNNLTYVLLVGDSRQVPSYRLGGESNDNVYAEVAGSDRYPDYFLGRFSAENTVDLEIQVRKTMMYESAPAEVSHFPVYAGIASREGPGDNREYDYQHIRKIGNKLAAYTYTSGYEFFEGSQGGLDASGTPQAQDVSDAINQGVGIINYCGHGDWNMFVTSYFMNQHVEALRNYNKLPFIISTACSNGDYYDQTCFAEKWLRAQQDGKPTGAVATLMSSIVQAWSPPMAGQDEMADLITENMSGHVKRTFGGIVFNGLCKILDVYNDYSTTRTWLIFGDPSLHIRTAVPQTLAIDHVDTICRNYPNYLTLTSSVEDVDVTLSANGKILKQAFIANAPLSIAVSDLDQYDTIYVVGTKYNHTPYMGILRGVTCSSPPPDPTEYKVESGILYPNPAIDYISISEKDFPDGKDVSCYIFDMNGKQILHILKNKGDNKIDIQKFTSGSYVLKMMADGKEIQTYKFVVI
ncbi:C25 family cysteine peptidase, partial [Bacteroidales bacterium OttesenSCG-928-A14]|nr:C25 family cysteine peptidase [Bacteroidales bacterium OttesenSCG-928-A14]